MKKNYIFLLFIVLSTVIAVAQEAQKNFINYQGVARNAESQLMVSEVMTINIALKFGTANAVVLYEESHAITTDANGVFSLLIGNGNAITGNYNTLAWGSAATFVTVSMNGNEIGTTEMMAVPYAISSGDADDQSANEVAYDNSVSGLAATNTQEAIDALVSGGSIDADADPTNEIQDISLSGTELTITDGATIDLAPILPPGGTDDQISAEVPYDNTSSGLTATNAQAAIDELVVGGTINTDNQGLVLTGDILFIENGTGSVDLSAYAGDDADADSTNEIQDISLLGTKLTITDGATIDLAPILPPGGTDDQNASEVSFDNTVSGLTATETQAAIDELAANGGTGASSINDLSDGKSDTYGSSLFLGFNTGLNDDGTDNRNVGVGYLALNKNTTGIQNTASGNRVLISNTTGSRNTANGYLALNLNTEGSYNTATGNQALSSNTEGNYNVANGSEALRNNTGNYNVANGYQALRNNTGNNNVANGSEALRNNITGVSNTANGFQSLYKNTKGNKNTATGSQALYNNETAVVGFLSSGGSDNTANGYQALYNNTTGEHNTANGSQALYSNIGGGGIVGDKGNDNSANGYKALYSNIIGSNNTATGSQALYNNIGYGFFGSVAGNNTANGYQALYNNTEGNQNTATGSQALASSTQGSNNIGLGYDAQVPSNIGSNQVRIGNNNITYAGIQVSWTVTSDLRWKDHVRDLPYGLSMVSQLRPVDYIRKNNEKQTRETGFIAQEVEKTLAAIGYNKQGFLTKDDKGYLSIRYNDLIPILTKAIQEQQVQIEVLKTESKRQNTVMSDILKRVNSLENAAIYNENEAIDLSANDN